MLIAALVATSLAEPILVSIGSWLVFEKTEKGWGPLGAPNIASVTRWQNDEGIPLGSLDLVSNQNMVLVSGGKAKFTKLNKLGLQNRTYEKIATDYVHRKNPRAPKPVLQSLISADLNGDGSNEVFMSAGATGSKWGTPVKGDFGLGLLRTVVSGKVKAAEFFWDNKFGLQHGPFRVQLLSAGDYDGDGKREFVTLVEDPWGREARLMRLTNKGTLETLAYESEGE